MPDSPAKPTRGGARKGAGRKSSDGAQGVVNVTISMPPEDRDTLKALGGSAWVRRCIKEAKPFLIVIPQPD
jgi:hypothetical protein